MPSILEKPGLNPGLQNNMRPTKTPTFFSGTRWNKLQPPRSTPSGILMTSLSCSLNPTETTLQHSFKLQVSHSFPQTPSSSPASSFRNPVSFHIIKQIHITLNWGSACACWIFYAKWWEYCLCIIHMGSSMPRYHSRISNIATIKTI